MSTTISPKVTASTVTAVLVTTILANVTLITPDLFAGLGAYGPLLYGVIIAASGALAGWWKTDPLRAKTPPANEAKAQVNAIDMKTSPNPEPAQLLDMTPAEPGEVTPVYEATPNS